MQRELYTTDSFVHVFHRGNRKMPIVRDEKDKWHFLQTLYYLNTEKSLSDSPFRDLKVFLEDNFYKKLIWPDQWSEQNPIVAVVVFVLLDNHFHLLLKEVVEGGIAKFMQKMGTSMSKRFNTKYEEVGRLFQGPYESRVVHEETYLKYLSVYIQVKNAFELYPGGLKKAIQEFDKAYEWATNYAYCSLGDYAGKRNSPIVDKDLLGDLFKTPGEYKRFAKDAIMGMNLESKLGDLIIE